ncbi:glycosyl hydrolase family 85-domain-containing protein [Phaeosphaeriaceae sp. PMI808]|nr:glycosyl hydrolase family 85-domain-containing protein [Phaeosphaeriaceae sp. PMI808]
MAISLGWKDILRPIRDGYRHLFPTPDTGPTPEERRKRREMDRLKGFTYFDTFEQLEAWDESESDPLQRANTPLLPRYAPTKIEKNKKSNVLLCHDYAGNYHDYENAQEVGVGDEKYACQYLQYVDTFVYFSHKLVCIPPPTWTNTLHRNGVKVLGTILLEPQTKDIEKLLQHSGTGDDTIFGLARKLADIATHFGFDGWLVNIEKLFPLEVWNPEILQTFLAQLRSNLGDQMQLICASNLPFTEACGSVLTNYCWSRPQATESLDIAENSGISPESVFFGVDVWAQNSSSLLHPRITYPRSGGGGTNIGIAVATLAEMGLSVGVFAPAWSFEHFPGRGREIEATMWEGKALPDDIECSCGNASARHRPTQGFSITQYAREFPAGSDTFFHTDFSRAFGRHGEEEAQQVFAGHDLHAQFGAQSILPATPSSKNRHKNSRLSYKLEDTAGKTNLIIEANNGLAVEHSNNRFDGYWLPLYKLNMPADGSLQIEITCRNLLSTTDVVPSIYLRFSREDCATDQPPQLIPVQGSEGMCTKTTLIGELSELDRQTRCEELGFYMSGFSCEEFVRVLELSSITIRPVGCHKEDSAFTIDSPRIEIRGRGDQQHVRLCWSYTSDTEVKKSGVPFSVLTGPFSHFKIRLDGVRLGRAYALEHTVPYDFVERLSGKEATVEIIGVGFDGTNPARHVGTVRISR